MRVNCNINLDMEDINHVQRMVDAGAIESRSAYIRLLIAKDKKEKAEKERKGHERTNS